MRFLLTVILFCSSLFAQKTYPRDEPTSTGAAATPHKAPASKHKAPHHKAKPTTTK